MTQASRPTGQFRRKLAGSHSGPGKPAHEGGWPWPLGISLRSARLGQRVEPQADSSAMISLRPKRPVRFARTCRTMKIANSAAAARTMPAMNLIQPAADNSIGLRTAMEARHGACGLAPTWPGLVFRLWLLFAAELLIVAALSIPKALSFNLWLFEDPRAILATNFLITKGYQPAVDFGYIHGLLPLFSMRGWALFGTGAISACAAMLESALLAAWGFACPSAGLRLGWPGRTLIVLIIPFSIIVVPPDVVHIIEPRANANWLDN